MTVSGQPLRVAQLVEALESGGAEALAVDIAGALAARGHVSHLIVLRGGGPFQSRLGPGVRLHDLRRPRQDGSQAGRIAYFLGTCRRLEALLREERIEVMQTHLPKANFLGLAMAWRGTCRVHATVHNNREFDYGDQAGRLKQRLRRAGYRGMLRHCRGIIAVSGQVRRSLLEELGVPEPADGRFRVVANGVHVAPRPTAAQRAAARAAWGLAPDEVLVVGVGRLTAQKDFGMLVRALSTMPAGPVRWKCIIAGEGEERAGLEQAAAACGLTAQVRLAGLVTDVHDLLAAADLFCLPSRYEGLPLVLLEAMAAGLPVAAFAIDGIADVVVDGAQARLAPPGDAEALGRIVAALLADRDERERLGAAGRRLVAERHGFERVISQLETAYRS